MKPSSAPPSPSCAPTTLLLQRRLCGRDCGKWRTVVRLGPTHVEVSAAQMLAQDAMDLDPQTEWRIVEDARHE